MRILAFGAHPDDCELLEGGSGARWAAAGHAVKFVALTNGDIGHFDLAGGVLARRRAEEVRRAGEVLGVVSVALDLHDGELQPTLENRKTVTRLIREWKADVVISHRPNDYHPDHRAVGLLVQDAGYMVSVPFWCPDVPHLTSNPVFLFSRDDFRKPTPFSPDIAVAIDDVIEKKRAACAHLESALEFMGFMDAQFSGAAPAAARDRALAGANKRAVLDRVMERYSSVETLRPALARGYGEARAASVKHAEAFEIGEYGRRPTDEEVRTLLGT
jgi:LmbE family N-acetylglucosaminyl deacetylase